MSETPRTLLQAIAMIMFANNTHFHPHSLIMGSIENFSRFQIPKMSLQAIATITLANHTLFETHAEYLRESINHIRLLTRHLCQLR